MQVSTSCPSFLQRSRATIKKNNYSVSLRKETFWRLTTVSQCYPLTLNPSLLISVCYSLTPLCPYLLLVSFIRWFFNHLTLVNMTHRACSRTSCFSLLTALLIFLKPEVQGGIFP
jgi:hypothetical protein